MVCRLTVLNPLENEWLRPHKRSRTDIRSHFKACSNCSKAKAKCEEVELSGCHRCRSKQMECSLIPMGAPYHRDPSSVSSEYAQPHQCSSSSLDIANRLESLEAAMIRLEQALSTSRPMQSSVAPTATTITLTAGAHTPMTIPTIPRRHPDYLAFHKVKQKPLGEIVWTEWSTSCWTDPAMYPDAVGRGLVTRAQVDMAFQL
jgi:hypothetical protein